MTNDRIAKLAEVFVAEYRDPDIDARLFFDCWFDRLRLHPSLADRLWKAVTVALGETHPGLMPPRKRMAYWRRVARFSPRSSFQPAAPS